MMIKIGTRGSQLALWQANYVANLLQMGGIETQIIPFETKGDKILNKSLSKIGSKGLFTAELEQAIFDGIIDIAVHSAKDLQSDLDERLEIIAFCERENPKDVLVSFNKSAKLANFDDSFILGTSSTRRVAMMRHYYPKIRTADVRGNLQTRMKKMEKGDCDALMLAYAGVVRMNLQAYIVEEMPLNTFTPAVGQGSVAVEASVGLDVTKKEIIRKLVNHPPTEICLQAERSFLKALQGGCSIPIFGLAVWRSEQEISLQGGLISLDGKKIMRENLSTKPQQAIELGKHLAEVLLSLGGDLILKEIKKQLH